MEKRKIYIITTIVILTMLTALALWYAYIIRQEVSIGQSSELDLYNTTQELSGRVSGSTGGQTSESSTTVFGTPYGDTVVSNTSTNETVTNQDGVLETNILATEAYIPESWSLLQLHQSATAGHLTEDDSVLFIDTKTGTLLENTLDGETTNMTTDTIPNLIKSYFIDTNFILLVKSVGAPIIINTSNDRVQTLYDTVLQVSQTDNAIYYTTPNATRGITLKKISHESVKAYDVKPETVWTSNLSGWLLQATSASVVLTQKASYNIPGYSYLLPGGSNKATLTTLVQDAPSLITNISQDAKSLLYSTVDNDGIHLYLKNLVDNTVITLSTKTLASKCAWGGDSSTFYCAVPDSLPSSTLPDSWYKGQVGFYDSLWRINAQSGDALELAGATNLDIIDIQVKDSVITFKDKTDQSLWAIVKDL